MCFEKRTDKTSPSAKPSQNHARKEEMVFPSLPLLSIFICRHILYKLVHSVKLKIFWFCGFETIICICSWLETHSEEVEQTVHKIAGNRAFLKHNCSCSSSLVTVFAWKNSSLQLFDRNSWDRDSLLWRQIKLAFCYTAVSFWSSALFKKNPVTGISYILFCWCPQLIISAFSSYLDQEKSKIQK